MSNEARTGRGSWWRVTALLLTLVLVGAACGDDDGDSDGAEPDPDGSADVSGTINIGWIPWDEDIAVTHLWKVLLEEQGYDVELTQLDVGPVYAGLAQGDVDLFLDAWLPDTHATYWEEFGDDVEELATWNQEATLHLAVPSYVDVDSIADLAGRADEFGGRIVGIEPGAGLMEATRERVIPGYGLDDYELLESSTPAMLAELEGALDREEAIVVTLWQPHWAYGAYDIKNLEDPDGHLGSGEDIRALGRTGFASDFAPAAQWLGNFALDAEQLNALTNLVIQEHGEGNEADAIDEWLSDPENRSMADGWIS